MMTTEQNHKNYTSKNKNKAIIYQSLYLANLLLLPGISFLYLLWLFKQNYAIVDWQRIHLYRAVQLSVIAGVLLVLVPSLVIFAGDEFEALVMVMLVYFVTIHALLVLLGMFNVARAMAKKLPIF